MRRSPHSLHPVLTDAPLHRDEAASKLHALAARQQSVLPRVAREVTDTTVRIPLTTVSLASNFDAYINIRFRGQPDNPLTSLLVDSGNSMLIVPSWEAVKDLPGYETLGDATEPWGSPAKVVRGPVEIPTSTGGVHVLEDCVFYACTGGERTANFGAGCLSPWSASGWNTPAGIGVTMEAPLAYNAQYPFAAFDYAPADQVLSLTNAIRVAQESELVLSRDQPPDYTLLDTIPNLEWMSLIPSCLTIGDTSTQWPGDVPSPIAMVDTGGGPVFLSDPKGYVYKSSWPHPTACPTWTSGSELCQCVSDDITLELAGADRSTTYAYTVHPDALPPPAQGLVLVMCKVNEYMRGNQGMNIGGLSALFNSVLVNYRNGQVGFKPTQ